MKFLKISCDYMKYLKKKKFISILRALNCANFRVTLLSANDDTRPTLKTLVLTKNGQNHTVNFTR